MNRINCTLVGLLRLDALASLALAVIGFSFTDWLTEASGAASVEPVRLVATMLAIYGIEQLAIARRPSWPRVIGLALFDAAFALAMLALALFDPTGAEGWLRWSLAVLGIVVAGLGALKVELSSAAERKTPIVEANLVEEAK